MLPTYCKLSLPDDEAALDELVALIITVFSDINQDDVRWRLMHMPRCVAFCARADEQLVGFKVGYAIKSSHYYSWLGGVHPQWLRQGIARRLMDDQHAWLQSEGFTGVETGAQATNEAMCELNLKSGFEVVGSREKSRGLQLIFEKSLTSAGDV